MASLAEMKQLRKVALDKGDSILAAAENASRALTDAENTDLDATMAEARALTSRIEASEKLNTLRVLPDGTGLGIRQANGTVLPLGISGSGASPVRPRGDGASETSHSRSLGEALRTASAEDVQQMRDFGRYLSGDATALADLRPSGDGGVFIPTIIADVVARNYATYSPVRDVSTVWRTVAGEPARFPVISDSESAVILAPLALTGADSLVSGDTPPTAVSGPMLYAHKFSSKPVLLPRETITDANLNVVEEVLSALLARITRTQNLKYTKGAGTTEPRGFMLDAVPYSAGAVALDLDLALDLAYSVPAMYRTAGVYMASDITVKYLRKLKTGLSGDKRALWKDAFEEGNATLGTPARLHGYSVIINNDMDSVSPDGTFAGVSPLAFGDFKRFIVREAEQGAPYIYRYAVPAKDGGAVIAFERSDSALIVPAAISKLAV